MYARFPFGGDKNVLELDRGDSLHSIVNVLNATKLFTFIYFFKDFIYLFLDRGGGREKHQCMVASRAPLTRDPAHNPGTCPDWKLNQGPFGS